MRRRGLLRLVPAVGLVATACGGSGGEVVTRRQLRTVIQGPEEGGTATPVPPPEYLLSTEEVRQGGTVLLSLLGQVSDGAVTYRGKKRPLSKGTQSIYAFIGIDVADPPGIQTLKIDFTLTTGSKGSLETAVKVLETAWTTDNITLPPRLASLLDPRSQAEEVAFIQAFYDRVTPEKLWKSEVGWLLPVGGPLTTRFGENRSYNGSKEPVHHLGTDLGGEMGTPVGATNRGRVVMARQLSQRGNMVVIDHGGGLMSGYAHLRVFSVAEGQMVEAGETIGEVGSTGLSTGAHLHWEMAANGVLVDGLRFTDGSNGF